MNFEDDCIESTVLVTCNEPFMMHFDNQPVTVLDENGDCWIFFSPKWPGVWTLSYEEPCSMPSIPIHQCP